MDLSLLNLLVCLLSAVVMMASLIYMLIFILSSYSSKSGGMSQKLIVSSLLYFFGSTILLYMGVEWLNDIAPLYRTGATMPFHLDIGASALAFTAVLHIFFGLLTAFLYLKGRTQQRVSNSTPRQ